MATWLLIAALATIGITALLIGVLHRANRKALEEHQRRSAAERPGPGD